MRITCPAQSAVLPIALLFVIYFCVSVGAQPSGPPRYASGQVDPTDPSSVDVALVLAVDVSSSIKPEERHFQREAYAEALQDPRVANIALGGRSGRVAIAYLEWSGPRHQRLYLPMRVISTPHELARFGEEIMAIEDVPGDPMFLQRTAVGDALIAAERAFAGLQVSARDYVIDISGDGIVNDGASVLAVRERLLSLGLTVNGLPIEVSSEPHGLGDDYTDMVTRFYADCVIGGPGAFHVVARGFGDVRQTLIMKLMLEMAQIVPEEKRRIAAAWNRVADGRIARVIPATVLQLSPPVRKQPVPSNCGDALTPGNDPFRSRY